MELRWGAFYCFGPLSPVSIVRLTRFSCVKISKLTARELKLDGQREHWNKLNLAMRYVMDLPPTCGVLADLSVIQSAVIYQLKTGQYARQRCDLNQVVIIVPRCSFTCHRVVPSQCTRLIRRRSANTFGQSSSTACERGKWFKCPSRAWMASFALNLISRATHSQLMSSPSTRTVVFRVSTTYVKLNIYY